MSRVLTFLANGLEEVECLAVVDVLRRAGIETELVSIGENKEVVGSHGIIITCDTTIKEVEFDTADVIFLPGGMPGTKHLAASELLNKQILAFYEQGKRLAAICAAPSIYGRLGLLRGKKATCYPGWEQELTDAEVTGEKVVTDGNITTAKGVGAALDLGLELVRILVDERTSADLKKSIQY